MSKARPRRTDAQLEFPVSPASAAPPAARELAPALRALAAWFERQKRVLPWRDQPTLYRVWISEIMLQQTQVATVIPYFERFVARFPDVETLAGAPEQDVLHAWAGLGYYSRARNLQRAAGAIVARGGFPRDRDGWLELPGIGPYTAGAIVSIALDQPVPILDGNVERVLSRVRRVARGRGDAAFKARLWRLSRIFVERAHALGIAPSSLNQSLMELGATICSPRSPRCPVCPLAPICRARQRGEPEAYPPRKKAKEWIPVREELHGVFDGDGRLLVRQRRADEWRAGLWDLAAERPERSARFRYLGTVETRHVVTRHKVTRVTHVWLAPSARKGARAWVAAEAGVAEKGGSGRWVCAADPEVPVGSALKRTLKQVRETFPEALPSE